MDPTCNCAACVEDPNLTCSYTGEDVTVVAVYVANAYRGNLIVCPGGPSGAIGALLHKLNPPQHYSHMGVMIADHDLIRHCTTSQERLTSEEYYSGAVLGVSAPVDGLDVEHVEHGWPGAVTQSAMQVFFAERYGNSSPPPGMSAPYHGSNLPDLDSPSHSSQLINAVSFDGIFDDGTWFPALVVKPCPELETPRVTDALNRIADEVTRIHAHYRFYAYTDGSIGGDPNYAALQSKVLKPVPDWDPDTMTWKDWSNPAQVRWLTVPSTVPAVCSSFVWQAVRNINKAATGESKRIILDWAENEKAALGEAGGRCRRAVAPDWSADVPGAFDGLYSYDEGSRRAAGEQLSSNLSDTVLSSLKDALSKMGGPSKVIADAIDDAGRGSFIAACAAGVDAVAALLSSVAPPVGAAVAVVGTAFIEQLIELLYDMPEDIANQLCNSFAFDCHRGFDNGDTHCVDASGQMIHDVDSTNWDSAPGTGSAVSPDNIHMFWDAPDPNQGAGPLLGVYGYNAPVQLVVAAVKKPRCELVPSTGTARIGGNVFLGGQPVFAATVTVNCQKSITRPDIGYDFTVRSGGRYKLVARYEDPATGITFCGEATTGVIQPGTATRLDINVDAPPPCLRNVVVAGVVRVDDVSLFGADHAQTQFSKTLYVQHGIPVFDEAQGTWTCDADDDVSARRHRDEVSVGAGVGDANGGLHIAVSANADLSVDVVLTGTIKDLSATRTVTALGPGDNVTVHEFSLDTGGPFNDRAYFRGLTITNNGSSAI